MALTSDEWVDRRKLKRRLILWRVIAIAAVIAVIIVAASRFAGIGDGAHVARLAVNGVIVDDQDRDRAIHKLSEDDAVRAVIVQIDSPGGTVVGGEVLYKQLKSLSGTKPVVAVMGQLGTSAAYMAALGSQRIFARDGTITGSIGVILQTAIIADLLESWGIQPTVIKSGPYKAQPNPLEPLSSEAREMTLGVVMDMHEMFIDIVAENRGLERERVRELADGRIFTGRQALKTDLIDAIGGQDEALAWLASEHGIDDTLPVHDVEVHKPEDRLRDMLGQWGRKALFSERLTLDGLVSVWHPSM